MHKNATKCNTTQSKWCINKHGALKIIDMFETYQPHVCQSALLHLVRIPSLILLIQAPPARHGQLLIGRETRTNQTSIRVFFEINSKSHNLNREHSSRNFLFLGQSESGTHYYLSTISICAGIGEAQPRAARWLGL
jgi:hypothetical protein